MASSVPILGLAAKQPQPQETLHSGFIWFHWQPSLDALRGAVRANGLHFCNVHAVTLAK
jgi:hypothetical protein